MGAVLNKARHYIVTILIFTFILTCVALSLFNTGFRGIFFSKGPTPETLGLEIARANGCFHCHGTFGEGKVPNPDADAIPSWQGFSFMMSMKDESELREWILDGAPAHLRQSEAYKRKQSAMTVHMPAYRGRLTPKELNYLIAYYYSVSGIIWPDDPLAEKGLSIAGKKGCFSCHGFGGRIDLPNPGSLVGRIPAWSGADYRHLVKDDAELLEWILDGRSTRLEKNFFARWFTNRQVIKMPAYRDRLSAEEQDAIIAYIHWLRDPNAAGQAPSFSY